MSETDLKAKEQFKSDLKADDWSDSEKETGIEDEYEDDWDFPDHEMDYEDYDNFDDEDDD